MRRRQFPARGILYAVAALGWYLVSCTEVPVPEGGVASISNVQRPSPALVVGDTMRDSTGVVAPLRVIAFGLDGEPLDPQPAASFVTLDTLAHLVGNLLVGDHLGTAKVIGVVGSLQTRQDTIPVILRPDTLVASDSVVHRVSYILAGDTVVNSAELGTFVRHLLPTPTGVRSVIVNFEITKSPVGTSAPTAVLVSGNRVTERDTSDSQGKASRVARLRLNALSDFATDTVMVNATASYRGQTIGVVTFTVVFTKQ